MRGLRSVATAVMCGVVGLGGVGCVSQGQYDELNAANQALEARVSELGSELDASQRLAERRQDTISRLQSRLGEVSGEADTAVAGARTANEDLRRRYEALQARVENLSLGGNALDAETEAALRQLASDNSGLFSFDAERGVVRVSSDLTFASGSATVQDTAKQALGELARVLTRSIGDTYDIRVVGHTDSQRMSNQATIRRFGDNRGLSVARAIAVSETLQESGVAGERIETSGWGPHRPLVANNPTGGTRQNRRVEVFVVPTTAGDVGSAAPDAGGGSESEEPGFVK